MLHTSEHVEHQLDRVSALRHAFSKAFYEAQNEDNAKPVREQAFHEACIAIRDAQEIVNELAECTARFPDGLPVLPHDLRYETDHAYAEDIFDAVRDDILAGLQGADHP